MGNCVRKQPSMEWAGEDWGSLSSETPFSDDGKAVNAAEKKFPVDQSGALPPSAAIATEVKIRITKKQLEQLLGKVDVQGLSAKQVLAQLMDVSDRCEAHQRHWRPALQSIPEVN